MASRAPRKRARSAQTVKWTEEDIQSSKQACDTLAGLSNTLKSGHHPAPMLGYLKFKWNRYGEEFRAFLRATSKEQRFNLLACVTPYAALSPTNKVMLNGKRTEAYMEGFKGLYLEKIRDDPEHFIALYEEVVKVSVWEYAELAVVYCMQNNIALPCNGVGDFSLAMIDPNWHEGDKMERRILHINVDKCGMEAAMGLYQKFRSNGAVPANMYNTARSFAFAMIESLCSAFQEWESALSNTFHGGCSLTNVIDGCGNGACPHIGKEKGAALNFCAGCKKAAYCSKNCQKMDWKEHKHVCKKSAKGQDSA